MSLRRRSTAATLAAVHGWIITSAASDTAATSAASVRFPGPSIQSAVTLQTSADRERFQVPAHRAAGARKIREPGLHLRRVRKGGVPAVPELGDAPERARRVAADPDRDRALRGLRRHAERLEAHELAPM